MRLQVRSHLSLVVAIRVSVAVTDQLAPHVDATSFVSAGGKAVTERPSIGAHRLHELVNGPHERFSIGTGFLLFFFPFSFAFYFLYEIQNSKSNLVFNINLKKYATNRNTAMPCKNNIIFI
jgi:hypothetical protein